MEQTSPRRWTPREVELARKMHAAKAKTPEIAAALGRTRKSVKSILYQPRVKPHVYATYLPAKHDGPPIGRDPEEERLARNAVEGSAKLLDALLRTVG